MSSIPVVLTFLVAMMLTSLPLPESAIIYRPEFGSLQYVRGWRNCCGQYAGQLAVWCYQSGDDACCSQVLPCGIDSSCSASLGPAEPPLTHYVTRRRASWYDT